MQLNILICGIGGQGVVFFGNFLKKYLFKIFPEVNIVGTESRGVSQREGSVNSTIRIINSSLNQYIGPDLPLHKADIVIAYEPIELLRNINYCHDKTIILVNNSPILPKSAIKQINSRNDNDFFKLLKEPKRIIDKSIEFLNKISLHYKASEANIDPNIWDFERNIENKAVNEVFESEETFYNQEEATIKNFSRFSYHPRLIDFDLTSILMDQNGSMDGINFVFFGILQELLDGLFPKEETIEFIKSYFKTIGKESTIEQNMKSFNLGIKIGYKIIFS